MTDPDGHDIQHIIGLDLGQSNDPSALVIAQKRTPWRVEAPANVQLPQGHTGMTVREEKERRVKGEPVYDIVHLQRFDLGTAYPEVARQTAAIASDPRTGKSPDMVVDATGIGAPVVDVLRDEGLRPVEVTITSGSKVKKSGREYRVPKADLVTTVQTLLQTSRLRVSEALPLSKQLAQEMKLFRVKVTESGHARFEHAAETDHDDLVLACALATWYGENRGQGVMTSVQF
jgi:hypothetical protein